MKKVVISLSDNLKHQHSKVRKSSLNALKSSIGCRGANDFLEDALPQLKMTINDRHHDVRRITIDVIDFWLQNMDLTSLRKFEKDLVLFLLNGASDEIEEIRELSISVLERHGNHMKEALVALGDEQADANDDVSMKD
jgi:HEAT repeat protein